MLKRTERLPRKSNEWLLLLILLGLNCLFQLGETSSFLFIGKFWHLEDVWIWH